MHAQDVAPGPVEPREDDDPVAGADAVERIEHAGVERERRLRRSLVRLLRRARGIGQRRLDDPDRPHVELVHVIEPG